MKRSKKPETYMGEGEREARLESKSLARKVLKFDSCFISFTLFSIAASPLGLPHRRGTGRKVVVINMSHGERLSIHAPILLNMGLGADGSSGSRPMLIR